MWGSSSITGSIPDFALRNKEYIEETKEIWETREGNKGDMGNIQNSTKKAGYEYLLAYKITVPIYDYTVVFCERWIDKKSRTYDQMTQAARSGTQNIAEGNKQQGLKGYIKLTGVDRGSLEELLNDYLAFARQNKIPILSKEKARKIREIGEIWGIIRENPTLPDNPDFPNLP